MSAQSAIEWTDATWNPVTGCTKVSAGCKHCYAERDWARLAHLPAFAGRAFTDVACHADRLDQPLRWKKPRRVFVDAMSDLFHEAVPDAFIDQVFARMIFSPLHTFQILTKRANRMLDYMRRNPVTNALRDLAPNVRGLPWQEGEQIKPWPRQNIQIGVSVEDQATADQRIPLLLQTPAAVRWISAEPLIGAVDMTKFMGRYNEHFGDIDWVVAGGESGAKARPMHPGWARQLRDQCAAAGVPFLFKQWGEWAPALDSPPDARLRADHIGHFSADGSEFSSFNDEPIPGLLVDRMCRIGRAKAGRLLDGVLHDAYPATIGGAK